MYFEIVVAENTQDTALGSQSDGHLQIFFLPIVNRPFLCMFASA